MNVTDFLRITDPSEIAVIGVLKENIKGRGYIGNKKSHSFVRLSFADVTEIRRLYVKGDIVSIVSKTLGMGWKELSVTDYTDFLYYIKFVEDQLTDIHNLEKALNEPEDQGDVHLMEMAGVEKLGKFNELNIINALAGGDILKWDLVQRMSYEKIYVKLLMDKTKSGIDKRFMDLKSKKN